MDFSIFNKKDLEDGGVFVIMVGPPGSGKTTISEKLEDDFDFIRICPDDIRKNLIGDSTDQTRNEEVFSEVYSRLFECLEDGYNVVYDATNCRSNYRFKVLDNIKNFANKIYCFCATTPISECLDRNKNRYDSKVPEEVIEKMYFTLRKHPPTIFEGYDAIVRF